MSHQRDSEFFKVFNCKTSGLIQVKNNIINKFIDQLKQYIKISKMQWNKRIFLKSSLILAFISNLLHINRNCCHINLIKKICFNKEINRKLILQAKTQNDSINNKRMQNPAVMPIIFYPQSTGYTQYYPMYYMPIFPNYILPQCPQLTEPEQQKIQTNQAFSSNQMQITQQSEEFNILIPKKINNENANDTSEQINTNTEANKPKQKTGKKPINLLQKSTNIQKNYAKAIVSYACGQRVLIISTLGKKKGIEFLKIISKLKNKLKNINHIKNHTQKESYLSMFRILGNKFMKHEAISYIYHSNIQQKSCHLKHMKIVQQNLLKF